MMTFVSSKSRVLTGYKGEAICYTSLVHKPQLRDFPERVTNLAKILKYLINLSMDKSMIGDLDSLPEEDKLRMATMIDQLQIRDSLRMYNSLVERCFTDCVDTFKHKSLQKQEETCVRRCAEKFLKHSMRVGMRFAELNQGAATQD